MKNMWCGCSLCGKYSMSWLWRPRLESQQPHIHLYIVKKESFMLSLWTPIPILAFNSESPTRVEGHVAREHKTIFVFKFFLEIQESMKTIRKHCAPLSYYFGLSTSQLNASLWENGSTPGTETGYIQWLTHSNQSW